MIIGLTGTVCAGKGRVADYFKERGYAYFSCSDELRAYATEHGIEITRTNLQNLGNRLREENGNAVLANWIGEKIKKHSVYDAIVDSIRNPAEVHELRTLNDFYLIGVDAPIELRFNRVLARNRENDPRSFDDFLKLDDKDRGVGEKESGQGVGKCLPLADFQLINDGSLEDTKRKINEIYERLIC